MSDVLTEPRFVLRTDYRILDTLMGCYLVTETVRAGGSILPLGCGGPGDHDAVVDAVCDLPEQMPCPRFGVPNLTLRLRDWPFDDAEAARYVRQTLHTIGALT